MNKINKGTAIFILFLTLVVISGLWQIPIIYIITQANEAKVSGFFIQFEDGTNEPEVKTILENYNMTLNYSIDCSHDNGAYKYYIKVYKDNMPDLIRDGLTKNENWTDPSIQNITKGDYIIYPVTEQATQDKNFLLILEKNNLQVKKFVWCLVSYGGNSKYYVLGKNCITWSDAIRIKNELEKNEKVFSVMIEDLKY
jgi:hypothetical protein